MHGRRLRASAADPRRRLHGAARSVRPQPARDPVGPGRSDEEANRHAAIARRHLRPRLVRAAGDRATPSPARSRPWRPASRRTGYASTPEHRFIDEGYSGATLRPPGPRAAARRGGGRPARSCLRPLARPAGAPLRLPGPADRRVPPRRGRGRLPQPGDRPLAGGRPAAAGPGHGGRVRAGQDPGTQPPRQAARRARGCGQRPVGRAVRLSLHRQAGRWRRARATRSMEEEARVVRQIFGWVGQERVSIGEVCRRLQQAGLSDPHRQARLGSHDRVGHPQEPRLCRDGGFRQDPDRAARRSGCARCAAAANSPAAPTGSTTCHRASGSACRSRRWSRRRCSRPPRSSWRRTGAATGSTPVASAIFLQGLVVCRQCGYAYYGKAISLRAAKGKPRAYAYYRCCGSDAYRFGGQRVCANPQVRTDRLDEAVWHEVEQLLQDPSSDRGGVRAAPGCRRADRSASDLAAASRPRSPSCAAAWPG